MSSHLFHKCLCKIPYLGWRIGRGSGIRRKKWRISGYDEIERRKKTEFEKFLPLIYKYIYV